MNLLTGIAICIQTDIKKIFRKKLIFRCESSKPPIAIMLIGYFFRL